MIRNLVTSAAKLASLLEKSSSEASLGFFQYLSELTAANKSMRANNKRIVIGVED